MADLDNLRLETREAHHDLATSIADLETIVASMRFGGENRYSPNMFIEALEAVAVCDVKLAGFYAYQKFEAEENQKIIDVIKKEQEGTNLDLTNKAAHSIEQIKTRLGSIAANAKCVGVSYDEVLEKNANTLARGGKLPWTAPDPDSSDSSRRRLADHPRLPRIDESVRVVHHWLFGFIGVATAIVVWSYGGAFQTGLITGPIVGAASYFILLYRDASARTAAQSFLRAAHHDVSLVQRDWKKEIDTSNADYESKITKVSEAHDEALERIVQVGDLLAARLGDTKTDVQARIDAWLAANAPGSKPIDATWSLAEGVAPGWVRLGMVSLAPPAGVKQGAAMNDATGFHKNLEPVVLRAPWCYDRLAPRFGHVVFRCDAGGRALVEAGLISFAMQILARFPPGSARFLLLDPLGLGQGFPGLHALADYDEKLVTSQVWSDRKHIREQLNLIVEHIGVVIQKYLRTEYETIDQYNVEAGEIAEPYRFVLIQGFPENFDDEAVQALERILANGARCGVYVAIAWNAEKKPTYGFNPTSVTNHATVYDVRGSVLVASNDDGAPPLGFEFDPAVPNEVVEAIVAEHGRHARTSSRVEVHFDKVLARFADQHGAPDAGADTIWQADNAASMIAPLGPAGARKIQCLVFGEGGTTAHHALIIGKTGSGKSNLLHVIIVSLAEHYSPDQLQFYLADFKKGVEFKDYAERKLPHARVVAIESEFEFGLSVLRGLDHELTRRGELFRQKAVSELSQYRASAMEAMPRVVLIVDEFHELLINEGPGGREAMTIIERLVRQGRSFGMHIILASQSLGGLTLPRSVLDQIGVRIALQCSEADSRQVLADDNRAARLIERAGEAIYNDKNGLVEGNSSFQVALLPESDRKAKLDALRAAAEERYAPDSQPWVGPFVFEGSEPADVHGCLPLFDALKRWPEDTGPSALDAWVGEPIALLPPHAMRFKRQSGANMLVVERNEELAFGVVLNTLISIAAQETPGTVHFRIVDLSSADAPWADLPETFRDRFPHDVEVYDRRGIRDLVSSLADDCEARHQSGDAPRSRAFLVFFGLQRARDLRREEGFRFVGDDKGPSVHDQLATILREGPDVGIHTVIWCDTLQNLSRILDGASFNELGQRISGAQGQAESMKLFDDPVAARLDRDNRMICYDDEKVGVFTPVRPYRACPAQTLVEIGEDLSARWKQSTAQ